MLEAGALSPKMRILLCGPPPQNTTQKRTTMNSPPAMAPVNASINCHAKLLPVPGKPTRNVDQTGVVTGRPSSHSHCPFPRYFVNSRNVRPSFGPSLSITVGTSLMCSTVDSFVLRPDPNASGIMPLNSAYSAASWSDRRPLCCSRWDSIESSRGASFIATEFASLFLLGSMDRLRVSSFEETVVSSASVVDDRERRRVAKPVAVLLTSAPPVQQKMMATHKHATEASCSAACRRRWRWCWGEGTMQLAS